MGIMIKSVLQKKEKLRNVMMFETLHTSKRVSRCHIWASICQIRREVGVFGRKFEGSPQGGGATPPYPTPGCVGLNWREMGPFLAWREVNGVFMYGCDFRGLPPYGCIP